MATHGGAPTNQDEYPPSEHGGSPLKNMGGIQPSPGSQGVVIPPPYDELEYEGRTPSERLQSMYRTGDEMGEAPDKEVFIGTQKGFPIRNIR